MSAPSEQKTVRRLMDLEVDEVSLVDRPAIRRKFLLIKREGEREMGNFATEEKTQTQPAAASAEPAAVAKTETPAAPAPAAEPAPVAKAESEKGCGTMPKDEKKEKSEGEDELIGKLNSLKGAPKDAVKALVQFLSGKSDKKKSETEIPENLVSVRADGSIEIAPIAKGLKAMTAERTTALKEAALSLIKVIGESGHGDSIKALQEAMKELPSTVAFASEVQPVPTTKSETPVATQTPAEVDALKAKVEELTKRLATVEETRPAPKGESAAGTETVKKGDKGFWSGVL